MASYRCAKSRDGRLPHIYFHFISYTSVPSSKHQWPGRVAQSAAPLTEEPEVPGLFTGKFAKKVAGFAMLKL